MIIVLEEKHKQDLLTLSEYDVEGLSIFLNKSLDFSLIHLLYIYSCITIL